MPNMKVLRDPGFLYDLNYLFYAKFNTQLCIDSLADETKKEAYKKYLKETLQHFGEISDDLYVFYHAIKNDPCFITTFYMNPYQKQFATDFDFKYFKSLLVDTDELIKNLIRFYLHDLSEEALGECFSSTEKLFSYIKASKYSGEEKSKLYEFFINPAPYLQALQYELIEKEILLSVYYKDNYDKIIEAHNNTTFEVLCQPVTGEKDLSFLNDNDQVLYTSYCLLHKYLMKLFFVSEGAIYLLGCDYVSIINALVKAKKTQSLDVICGALSEPSRVQILNLLLERKEATCKDLEKHFSFSGSTAYHHISLLAKAGAVKVRNEGKTIYYSIDKKYFNMLRKQLKAYSEG
ncbi:MAG: winged helix-turn-helix transcriptional regulator [Clostridia bacterium]|nr:winged helix-turn-helix transcriptional regulator [Clostridia bacterium]